MIYFVVPQHSVMDSLVDLSAIKQRCRGVAFVVILSLTSFLGIMFFSPVILFLFLFRFPSARFIADTIVSGWFAFLVATFELIYGVKIVVDGDPGKIDRNASAIIVMNHRTRLDWMFYFAVQARYGTLRRFKISLKDGLKHAPGPGWAMQIAHFLFLKRNWESDKERIENWLKYFNTVQYRPQLLLFPEGTDLQEESLEKSRRFAKKNDLDEYQYVLHPRTTGFTCIFDLMKKHNNLEQVVDVTVSYPQNICQDEAALLSGNLPKEIVFSVNCFNVNQIDSSSEKELSKWLESRWKVKEDFLKSAYEDPSKQSTSHFNGFAQDQNKYIAYETTLMLIFELIVYGSITVFMIVALVYSIYFRWLFLAMFITNAGISSTVGFHNLFAALSDSA